MRLIVFLALITCSALCNASLLPKSAPVPGGVVIIDFDLPANTPPKAYYEHKPILVIPNQNETNNWLAVIGIPLTAKPGTHQITLENRQVKHFTIKPKQYPQQVLTIKNKRKVQPLPEDLAIIEKEYLETIQTYDYWADKKLTAVNLKLPVKGRRSSKFGLSRIMNNILQNPHSGLDLAAPKGTPVTAAKDGTVINIGNFFYSGNIVFVDHGQGFITSYCHLDSVAVNTGQELQQGDLIGTVGNTGRATGPHLHWSVSLNGVRVDPELFVDE